MSNNQMSKKELKAPDYIYRALATFYRSLRENFKAIILIAICVVVATAVITAVNYFTSKKEQVASAELFKALKSTQTADGEVDNNKVVETLNTLLAKLGTSTVAFVEANYRIAEAYYKLEKYDDAVKSYDVVIAKNNKIYKTLAFMGKAYSQENKGDFTSAIDSFTQVTKVKEDVVYKAVAMLSIGRCYKKLGQKDKAMEAYDSVIIAYPDTDYARTASAGKSELN